MKDIVTWLNNKEHLKYSNQRHIEHDDNSQLNYIRKIIQSGGSYLVFWENGDLVGTASISVNKHINLSEIGILISPIKKGQGYGKRVFGSALEFCIETIRPFKIRCGCSSENVAMQKILLNSRFQLEAILIGEEDHNGSRADLVLYSKFLEGMK